MVECAVIWILLISALTLEVTFHMLAHFWHPWPLGQKNAPQIFERWCSNKVIEGNVQEGSNFKV